MARGKFIVFEGGEGSGKSTVSKHVVGQLKAEGKPVLWTYEPGGSPFAKKIRELILSDDAKHAEAETMFGLFWAARWDHLIRTVRPALELGLTVISDRFDASTYAYQIAGQEQPQLEDLFWKMRAHYVGDTQPDTYLFFDVDPAVGLARAKSRADKNTHFDDRELAFHHRVRDGFWKFGTHVEEGFVHIPFVSIDANQPEPEVKQAALDLVRRLLK